jgi:hypothetical protein
MLGYLKPTSSLAEERVNVTWSFQSLSLSPLYGYT